jgi:hypothetical protein
VRKSPKDGSFPPDPQQVMAYCGKVWEKSQPESELAESNFLS